MPNALGIFLAIRPERIIADIGNVEDSVLSLLESEKITAESESVLLAEEAESWHRRMLLSVHMDRYSSLPKDLRLFYATLTI